MPHKKVAVVTGASRGIGYEAAGLLQKEGYTVYGLSRSGGENGGFTHLPCDVSDEGSVNTVIREIIEREGRLDLLVCNAGYGIAGSVENTDMLLAQDQFNVNFFGAFACIKAALPYLRQSAGRIVVMSSAAAVIPIPFQAFYSASKAALNAFVLALAGEVKPFGVSVCAVLPGDVKTGFTAAREKQDGEGVYEETATRSIRIMERDEQNGMEPVYVAKKIIRVVLKRRVKPLYVVGLKYRAVCILQKLLPARFVSFIVGRIYA